MAPAIGTMAGVAKYLRKGHVECVPRFGHQWVRNNFPSALNTSRRMSLASRRFRCTAARVVPMTSAMASGSRIGLLPLSRLRFGYACSFRAPSGPRAEMHRRVSTRGARRCGKFITCLSSSRVISSCSTLFRIGLLRVEAVAELAETALTPSFSSP